ncbi:oligopeptidase B [Bowdeniella nasicola]|uniref:Oligopeptidase B n=1 Tax=Bowdeniella nasicola TaxID=208480 RepID=A0A1Q5Q0N1_9ACTO|nr:S9 family peptidase [Bowdeniella nasicola]OKL53414.1 oligopeptidase B [Bowdeniella nasicola]
MTENIAAPRAEHRDITRSFHGEDFVDSYEWLRNKDDAEVIDLLNAENAYTDAKTAHLGELKARIFDEIKSRTKETDLAVPSLIDGYWYYSRTTEGEQYPVWARIADTGVRPELIAGEAIEGEQILIDGPTLATGQEFFKLGGFEIAPADDLLAYTVDNSGDERHDVVVKNMSTGEIIDDSVTGVGYGLAFTLDASHLYYVRVDDAWRPHQVWRHELGSDPAHDVLVYQEDDERYWMGIAASRDNRHIVIGLGSSTTGESYLLDAADTAAEPVCVAPREQDIDYSIEVASDHLLITHNANHIGFEVSHAPIGPAPRTTWQTVLAPGDGERIIGVDAFDTHAVVSMRSGGVTQLRVLPKEADGYGEPWDVPTSGEVRTVELMNNPRHDAREIRYRLESFLIPATVCEIDVTTHESEVLKQTEVLGGYDPNEYREQRLWVEARDGVKIPVSLVARADIKPDGTNPGLLYGYGSYEVSINPSFVASRLSMLDRGMVFAIAHIRGGGEMGRQWYDDGKLAAKMHTFEDFVDVGRFLVESGWVAPDRLAAEGRSAGGLLMGAITNLAPDLWRVVHAGVPFVDALTTILNPDLPLTVGEWEEWGNPIESEEIYRLMRSYSPYENIAESSYPAILATTSLNDTRVFFVEPLKWVQRLRETVTNDPSERPILLRCQMAAGHGGKSGRYDAWHERAEELAIIFDQLGISQ